jgi:hypothetical protein
MLLASCSVHSPLHSATIVPGGGGRQIALLDWFRKRTRSTPSARYPADARLLVTSRPKYAIYTSVRTYSTQQAAEKIGIHWVTLHRWLAAKKIRPTIAVPMDGGRTLWRWTEKDIAKLEKVKKTTYRKGRGRKPKAKKTPR